VKEDEIVYWRKEMVEKTCLLCDCSRLFSFHSYAPLTVFVRSLNDFVGDNWELGTS